MYSFSVLLLVVFGLLTCKSVADKRQGFDLIMEKPKGHNLPLDTYTHVFDAIIPAL